MTVSETSIERILKEAKVSKIDNVHFKLEDIQKYLGCNDVRWLALHDNDQLVTACGIVQREETAQELKDDGILEEVKFISSYVCQLSSLKSGHGYGRALLEHVLDAFENVWLHAMPGTESFYQSVTRLHEHNDIHTWSNGKAKIFIKSDKFAQRICDLAGAV